MKKLSNNKYKIPKKCKRVKTINYIVLLISFFIFLQSTNSQVQVILQQPPPNQFHVEDLWKLTLINSLKTPQSVYITGSITESEKGTIISAVSKPFILHPGAKKINTTDLGNVDVEYQSGEIKDLIKKTGSVSAGYYNICIKVFSSPDNNELGSMCIDHEVNNFSNVILISPADYESIIERLPIFTWLALTPVKSGQTVTYAIKIVEILPRQSPVDALLSNPVYFEQNNLVSPVIRYPVSSREFEKNKHYAWKIKAFVNGIFVSESEAHEFRFSPILNEAPKDKIKSSETGCSSFTKKGTTYSNLRFFNFSLRPGGAGIGSFTSDPLKRPGKIILSGSSKIYTQKSNRMGTNQDLPPNLARWEFNPTLTYYGIPLSLNLLLTTEQKTSKQNINNLCIGFEFESLLERIKSTAVDKLLSESKIFGATNELAIGDSLKSISHIKDAEKMKSEIESINSLKDPDEIIDKIEKYGGKISGLSKFFLAFRKIGIGTNYPDYSNFTLSSIPVTGLNFEVNPGLFYFAVAGINNLKAVQKSENEEPVYERKILAAKLGLGKKENSHVYFTYLYAWDRPGSIVRDSSTIVNPMKNHILGLETKLNLFKSKVEIGGQIAVSLLTRDVTAPNIQNSAIPSFLQKMFGINMSSSADYFYTLNTALNIEESNTKLSGTLTHVGPGYVSLGAPNLKNDNLSLEIKLSQSILKNKIVLNSFFKRTSDNLIDWKKSTTKNTILGINLSVQFPGLPYLKINYSPNTQSSQSTNDSLKADNKISLFSISTGYSYNISNISNYTMLNISVQNSRSNSPLIGYNSNNFTLNHTLSFQFPLTVMASFGFTENKLFQENNKITFIDFNASYLLFNIWQNTLGINQAKELKRSNKFGLYLNSEISIPAAGTLSIRVEKNIYKDLIQKSDNYNEFIFRATISSNW